MTAAVETMAYVGEVPWHGLGVQVQEGLEVPELLITAGLNWQVCKEPLISAGMTLQDHYALLRKFSDGRYTELGVCGKRYLPTQNAKAFEFFERFCKAGRMKLETLGSLDEGRQVWGLAKIEGGFSMDGDDVEQFILLSHPHIWGKSLVIKHTPIRVVCMNTLMAALRKGKAEFSMPHIYEFDGNMQMRAAEAVEYAMAQMSQFKLKAEFLASKKLDEQPLFRYIAEQFQPELTKEAEKIFPQDFKRNAHRILQLVHSSPGHNLKAANDTWWGAFNAVTYFYDHEYGQSAEGRLQNAWFGGNAQKKLDSLELAVKYAQAA